jgi:deoxyadenosine/deoxycytidine kinase
MKVAMAAITSASLDGSPSANGAPDLPHHLRYIVLEGCIGVGKTTLTHLLANRYDGRTILEVVEENPFLPAFYEDPVANAFKTQMFFLLSRFKQQEQILQADLFKQKVVSDYLFAKDRIFAELTLNGSEMSLYDSVFEALYGQIKTPDLVVYLQAPLEVILERIKRRGRSFEQDIDAGYLRDLIDAYNRFFGAFDECPLLVVETESLNFPDRQGDLDKVLQAIVDTEEGAPTRRVLTGEPRQPELIA